MTELETKFANLRSDMHGSLNWREPGATVVPSIPRKRRFWWRVWAWLTPRSFDI